MAENDRDDDESIFKVDTVPPPAGDSDAYNAPTRVGPASADEWAVLIRKADAEGKKSAEAMEQAPQSGRPKRPVDAAPQSSPQPEARSGAAAPPQDIPRIYSDNDNDNEDEGSSASTSTFKQGAATSAAAPPTRAIEDVLEPSAPASAVANLDLPGGAPAIVPAEPGSSSRVANRLTVAAFVVCALIFALGVTLFWYAR